MYYNNYYGNPYGLNFSKIYPRVVVYSRNFDNLLEVGGFDPDYPAASKKIVSGVKSFPGNFKKSLSDFGATLPDEVDACELTRILSPKGIAENWASESKLDNAKSLAGLTASVAAGSAAQGIPTGWVPLALSRIYDAAKHKGSLKDKLEYYKGHVKSDIKDSVGLVKAVAEPFMQILD